MSVLSIKETLQIKKDALTAVTILALHSYVHNDWSLTID